MNELYARPLLYDGHFDDMTRDSDFIESIIRAKVLHNTDKVWKVLELAAGSGRIISRLAESFGPDVSCFAADISHQMLDRGKTRYSHLNNLSWIQSDMLQSDSYEHLGYGRFSAVVLAANSLAHFHTRQERVFIHYHSLKLLERRGIAICAVMTAASFADSESGTVCVGNTSDENGETWDVYESSEADGQGNQIVRWFFVSESGNDDFQNEFLLTRFEPGQLQRELREAGAHILESYEGFSSDEKNWDICVYTSA